MGALLLMDKLVSNIYIFLHCHYDMCYQVLVKVILLKEVIKMLQEE